MDIHEEYKADLISVLNNGGQAVLRTDTLYGLVASANDQAAVAEVRDIKGRPEDKALIVLIADAKDAYDGAKEIQEHTENSETPVSIIVDSPHAPEWLRHENGSVAYRIPQVEWLRDILRQTGPLVAPSANPDGKPPAKTIAEAKWYFDDAVEFYLDGGEVDEEQAASRVIRIENGEPVVVRA